MGKVRVITLHQPWASLLAIEKKRFETRSWHTAHRGPLAIHAAKTKQGRRSCGAEITSTLTRAGYATFDSLPFGCVLALMNLVRGHSTDILRHAKFIDPLEFAFGDWSDGRFAWEMEMIHVFDPPIPARGHQGFWWWDLPDTIGSGIGAHDMAIERV